MNASGPKSIDLICMGEPMVEFVRDREDPRGTLYLQGFGGDTSNAAIAAARQGAKVGYVTALGQDPFGEALLDLWDREGVERTQVVRRQDASTGIYFVTPHPEGRNYSYFRAGSAASLIDKKDVPADYISASKALHVSGVSQAISKSACDAVFHAIKVARGNGTLVSYDSNLRLKLWPLQRAKATIHKAMGKCDIAFPSIDDSFELTGLTKPDSIADFYLDLGATIVALKLGREGALVSTKEERHRIPPHPVTALDSTGAGDAFAGAFLTRYLKGDDPFRAGRYAAVVAALTTTGLGAVAPIPSWKEVGKLVD